MKENANSKRFKASPMLPHGMARELAAEMATGYSYVSRILHHPENYKSPKAEKIRKRAAQMLEAYMEQ